MPKNSKYRVAIIDDDHVVANIMSIAITGRFPDIDVYTYVDPQAIPKMDIYFIDNEFNGKHLATHILERIRLVNPDSLVIAMSATLDMGTIQNLMNQGCNGVWDKNHLGHQNDEVFEIMENYMSVLDEVYQENSNSLTSSLKVMRDLLLQWNKRLKSNE